MPNEFAEIYNARVMEVFSGDDLMLLVDLGVENLFKKQRVRLHGVDTPSAIYAAADTDAGRIRNYVKSLTRDKPVTVHIHSRTRNSWVGVVIVSTGAELLNLNDDLISKGFVFKPEKAAP